MVGSLCSCSAAPHGGQSIRGRHTCWKTVLLSGNQEARQMNIIAEMAQDYKID
jgi:hypothetical protein